MRWSATTLHRVVFRHADDHVLEPHLDHSDLLLGCRWWCEGGELLSQPLARPVQADTDGARRAAEQDGDLLAGQPVDVVHQHGVALARRKHVDGIADELKQLPFLEASVRRGLHEEARLKRAPTEPHRRQVHGDAAQPGAKARGVAQLREAEVRAQQCFLHEVFRLLADHPLDDGLNTAAVALHERRERRRVASERGGHKLIVPHTHRVARRALKVTPRRPLRNSTASATREGSVALWWNGDTLPLGR
jgi:hypothetical protein